MPSIPSLFNLQTISSSVSEFVPIGNIYIVSKAIGSDGYDGQKKPFATIKKATEVIETLTPSPTNRFGIEVLDTETYTENFTLPRYTYLYFKYATIIGKVQQNADSFMKGFYIKNSISNCIEAGSFSGEYFFEMDFVHTVGNVKGVQHQNGSNRPVGTIRKLIIENPTDINAIGISVTTGLYPTPCNIEVKEVQIIGTGIDPVVMYYSAASANGIGKIKIGKVTTDAGVANSTCLSCDGTGTLEASVDSGNCTTAYKTAINAKLILIGNSNLQGAVIEGSSIPIENRIGNIEVPLASANDQQILVNKGNDDAKWEDLKYVKHDKLENRIYTNYTSSSLITTWFLDNNSPLITEGVQVDTKAYTPIKIGNIIKVEASYEVGRRPVDTTRIWGHIALFIQGTSPGYTLKPKLYPSITEFDTYVETLKVVAFIPVTSLTTLTFEIRAAINGFGTNDELTINGNSHLGPRGGGKLLSYIDIEERG